MKKAIAYLSEPLTAQRSVLFAFVSFLAIFSLGTVSFNDFYWHLAVGKWMFETKTLLTHDIFSLAFSGKEWLNNTWLFDGFMYQLYEHTRFWGLGLLRLFVFSGTFFFLIKAANLKTKKPIIISLALFLLTIPLTRNLLRPEIVSPFFIAYFIYVLYAFKYRHSKLIYTLPFAEALWVNLHGGFTSGIILVGIFFGSELIRAAVRYRNNILEVFRKQKNVLVYGGVLLATAIATLANPYGYRMYTYYYRMLSDTETLASVAEWRPVSLSSFLGFSLNENIAFVLFGWLAVSVLILKIIRSLKANGALRLAKNFGYEDVLLFVFFLLSTLQYVRGIHSFTIIAAFIFLKNIYDLRWVRRYVTQGHLALSFVFIICVIAVLPKMTHNRLNTGPTLMQQPREAVDFVLRNKLPGNYLNEYVQGSDLTWLLYPEYKVFMDGRSANVYDARFFWYYRQLSEEPILADAIEKYNIGFVIAPNAWTLNTTLGKSENWKLVFFDNSSSVYLRERDDTATLIKDATYTMLHPGFSEDEIKEACDAPEKKATLISELNRNMRELEYPLGSIHKAASLILYCNHGREELIAAERALKLALYTAPESTEHRYTLGLIQLKLEKEIEALKQFRLTLKQRKEKQIMTGYAIALFNLGNYEKAKKAFDDALWIPGTLPNEYYQVYGRTKYQLLDNAGAIDMFTRYLDLIPDEKETVQDYQDLANAYLDNGESEEATVWFKKASDISSQISPS